MYRDSTHSPDERAKDLLLQMTLPEKVGQMCQVDGRRQPETWIFEKNVGSFLHTTGKEVIRLQHLAQQTRLGIPIIFGIDAIHGHAFHDGATVFPTQLALASSWNIELLEEVAEITAKEVLQTGLHWTFSPVLCIGRDSRWGRVDETFGEDPYLIGKLAAAMIRGYQGDDLSAPERIIACAKHYAAHGETQGGRDSSEGDCSRRKLRSIFLPPFHEAVKAGCATFMTAYQAMDGVPCSANPWLLKEVLKDEWNFKGFVVTDWDNIGRMHREQKTCSSLNHAAEQGILSGNDMVMTTPGFYDEALQLVKSGKIKEELLDASCLRILTIKFQMGLFDHKRFPQQSDGIIGCITHRNKAYESALQSMVLLKNENYLLPLSKKIQNIAVIGPNADNLYAQLGDWSFGPGTQDKRNRKKTKGMHPDSVTILEGIQSRTGPQQKIYYNEGCDLYDPQKQSIQEAAALALKADVAIVVVGDDLDMIGETRDRADLNLTGAQQELLEAIKSTGTPLLVILINGKPLTIPWIAENADAILEAWNPGSQGGHAVASVLFGDWNPCGKLTISFPRHLGQQPVFYNQLPGWHSDRYIDMTAQPLFPFGFGLSYTTYHYSNLRVSSPELKQEETLIVSVDIENTGDLAGTEIVQLYINDQFSSVTTPVKELKGFQRVLLEPGEKKTARFDLPFEALALVNQKEEWLVEPGGFEIMVGSSSRDEDLLKTIITVIE
ncbi:MAG: glycoside hydrolase family 3 C-terminal domain-containing protein [SAR324 cluster bacterium]|nr:glycoside hydrolase family 3 C-terminal domain-containing protein [SAR324 cluster bacterium]